jgi:hypothetical protein
MRDENQLQTSRVALYCDAFAATKAINDLAASEDLACRLYRAHIAVSGGQHSSALGLAGAIIVSNSSDFSRSSHFINKARKTISRAAFISL